MLMRTPLHAGARPPARGWRDLVLRRGQDGGRRAGLENRMLKAYIRDWPEDAGSRRATPAG